MLRRIPFAILALLLCAPMAAASEYLDNLYAELANPDNREWRRTQADILRAIGCDTVQGFIFGEPMPEPNYRALVGHSGGAEAAPIVA